MEQKIAQGEYNENSITYHGSWYRQSLRNGNQAVGAGQAVLAAKKIIKTPSLSSMQMITMARKVLRLFMSIW